MQKKPQDLMKGRLEQSDDVSKETSPAPKLTAKSTCTGHSFPERPKYLPTELDPILEHGQNLDFCKKLPEVTLQ